MTFSSILAPLAIAASSTIGVFVIAVGLDDLVGILVAVKQKAFAWNKLPSFMASEFGTREAAALLGLVATAVVTAVGSALVHGGLTQTALQGITDAALAASTAGAGTMLLSVLSDAFNKFGELTGAPATAPAAPIK